MHTGEFDLIIRVRRSWVVTCMLLVVLLLALLSLAANILWIERWPMSGMALALLSVDREMNVPTWWSALVLAGLGMLTWLLACQRAGGFADRWPWWLLASGFLFMSVDETCMLHERLGGKIKLEGEWHHARWVLLWLPPTLLISGVVICRLWRSCRHMVAGLTLGILLYLGGAVGVEMLNAANRSHVEEKLRAPPELVEDAHQSFVPSEWRRDRAYYPYVIGTAVEELLEMLAPVIWLWVLLDKRNTIGPTGLVKQDGGPAARTG